ncbi:hypothetical protein H072_2839 [Dactylellina haptotyla CBS 200.50]|uniref:Uncharacterized protein n=1 Tax=Dactylellina haptotyla (strain CBS 200.50) TaxID=1284197 RepID=S8C642_DACHA|nr:hypothetical protein H072_2839 [Dactylellina haptotyla CBS 200.50]
MSSDAGQAIDGPSMDSEAPNGHVQVNPEPRKSTDVPLLIVEKTSDDHEVYGSVPGSAAYEKRLMDAKPDILQEYEDTSLTNGHPNPNVTLPTAPTSWSELPALGTSESDDRIPPISSTAAVLETASGTAEPTSEGDGGFDDFDDFGETVEGGDGFDDFGDFGDAEPAAMETVVPATANFNEAHTKIIPDFTKMSTEEIKSQVEKIVISLYTPTGNSNDNPLAPLPVTNGAFLTDRSQSLWTQLCTPPPLQPPNWKLSRIRRLFLVSLGVPVDLDEILPADTKQKKLVLPSSSQARKSTDANRGDGDKSARSSSRRRKEKDALVKLVDIPSARILCSTSDVKLRTFTVEELEDHVKKLEEVTKEASETLTYWLGRREIAMGDKEAFERVIENLVEFAKKKR